MGRKRSVIFQYNKGVGGAVEANLGMGVAAGLGSRGWRSKGFMGQSWETIRILSWMRKREFQDAEERYLVCFIVICEETA